MPQEAEIKPSRFGPNLSLYLDTSVIGGYFDPEFIADTRALWELREKGRFRFASSVIVAREVVRAPEPVRVLMRTTFPDQTVLPLCGEAVRLGAIYLAEKIVPHAYKDDALHVAICTVARIGFLVSWNFKHLVNDRREAGFNAVNILQGYPEVRIVTPSHIVHGHQEEIL